MDKQDILRRALLRIETLERQLEAQRRTSQAAIVGTACKLPGGMENLEDVWALVANARDTVHPNAHRIPGLADLPVTGAEDLQPGTITTDRFSLIDEDTYGFDAAFFGVSQREAAVMDPQQKLIMECCWRAFEDSGWVPSVHDHDPVGVFVGISTHDYLLRLSDNRIDEVSRHFGTGTAHSVASGRLSHTFGLSGPCMSVDTACSSSLVALHLARQSLAAGECDRAVVVGVNAILDRALFVSFSQAQMLAPDGRSKPFSAAADGYGRGEGVVAIVLRRLDDAIADGDRIDGVVLGSTTNHDAKASALTAPRRGAQADLVRDALKQAGLGPDDIDYVEAHGTGTPLGDPIEISALADAYADRSPECGPVRVGAIKANIGHLESTSGLAGLLKTLAMFRHQTIPAQLFSDALSPHIEWDRIPVAIARTDQAWPDTALRRAAVSSFGFSGSNAHAILAGPEAAGVAPDAVADTPGALLLSAKSEAQLAALARDYAVLCREGAVSWTALCDTLALGRAHFSCRAAVVADSAAEAVSALDAIASGGANTATVVRPMRTLARPEADADAPDWGAIAGAYLTDALDTWPRRPSGVPLPNLPGYPFDRPDAPSLGPSMAVEIKPETSAASQNQSIAVTPRTAGIGDHRIHGAVVVPAAFFLASGLGALAASGRETILEAVTFGRMLALASEAPCKVGIAVAGDDVQITSASTDAGADPVHMRGTIGDHRPDPMPDFAEAGLDAFPVARVFEGLSRVGFSFGPRFRLLDSIRRESGRSRATITPHAPETKAFHCDPATLDACIQSAAAALPDAGETEDLFVPVGVDKVWVAGTAPTALTSRAICRPHEDGAPGYQIDVDVQDETGAIWAMLRGLTVRPVAPAAIAPSQSLTPMTVLVDGEMRVETIALEADLTVSVHVSAATIASASAATSLVDALGISCTDDPNGAIVLRIPDAEADPVDLIAAEAAVMRTALGLKVRARLRVLLPESDTGIESVQLSALRAFYRSVAIENPALDLRILSGDLASSDLIEAALSPDIPAEAQIAGEIAIGAQLSPMEAPLPATLAPLDPNATYIVTGASGGLGRVVVESLADRGARFLEIVGRRPLDAALMDRMSTLGVTVRHHGVDLTDPSGARDALGAIVAEARPVRGVFHLAGVTMPALVSEITQDAVASVLGIKLTMAEVLETATQDCPLDHFVLFSSIAARFGSPGQSAYAAANAGLDAIAARRAASGKSALSIQWGPWGGAGMAADAQTQVRLAAAGLRAIDPEAGRLMFDRVLSLSNDVNAPVATLVDADWATLTGREPRFAGPLLSAVADAAAAAAAPRDIPRTRDGVREALAATLSDLTGTAPDALTDRVAVEDLGLDSLMAMELDDRMRKSFGTGLPIESLMEITTFGDLVDLVHGSLGKADAPAPVASELEEMDEAELDRMIAELEAAESATPQPVG